MNTSGKENKITCNVGFRSNPLPLLHTRKGERKSGLTLLKRKNGRSNLLLASHNEYQSYLHILKNIQDCLNNITQL